MRKVIRDSVLGAPRALLVVSTAVFFASSLPASGAGFAIFEAGSQATGMAGAFVAQATDGSAMFYNPAGLASNEKLTVMVGDTLIFVKSKLDSGLNPTPGDDYSAKQKSQIFFPPNFYVTYPVAKDVNISLGTWFPFGLSTAWENPDEFRGRFLSQRVDLRQYALGLQASAKLADWISIGAGPELRIGDVKLQRNAPLYNPFTRRVVDAAHVDIVSDGFETKVTWAAGILLKPTPRLRLGVSFHAHVDVDYEGRARFYQLPTGNPQLDAAFAARIPVNVDVPVATKVQFPSVTLFGASYDITDKLTVEVDGNYWSWKVFDQTELTFSPVDGKQAPNATLVHNWKNTWGVRAGVRYQAAPGLALMAGGLYDQTPQPDEDTSPLLPDANRTGGSIGIGLKIGKDTTLEASNLFLFFHDRTTRTNKDGFNGTYKTFADLLVLNVRTSF